MILERLSQQFAQDPAQQATLRDDLKHLLAQAMPLATLVPQLKSAAQREQALMLSYEVIRVHGMHETETAAYQQLITLLNLPPETVSRLEAAVRDNFQS